jgi:hypothetical protein
VLRAYRCLHLRFSGWFSRLSKGSCALWQMQSRVRSSSRRGPSLGVAKAMLPWEPRLAACIARHGMYEEAWDCLPVPREQIR